MSGANEALGGLIVAELVLAVVGTVLGIRRLIWERNWWHARAEELENRKRTDETREEERER